MELGKKRILLVEDEADISDLFETQLVAAGYKVTTASDGDEALRILSLLKFDILVTDHKMPGKTTGLALAQHALEKNPKMHIVLMSGNLEKSSCPEKVEFLSKPVEIQSLLDAVRANRTNPTTPS